MGRRVACARWHAGCGGALLGVVLACRLRLGCGSCQDGAPLARARGSRFAWKCVHGQDTCGKASDCAWVARNRLVSGVCGCLPAHVSRETFVLISHYIATIVSRETLRFQASQSCPTPEPRNPGTPEPRNPGTPEPRNPSFGSLCAKRGRVFPAPRMTPPSVVLRFPPSSPSPAALSSHSHPRFPLPCPRCTPPRLLPAPRRSPPRFFLAPRLAAARAVCISRTPAPPARTSTRAAPPHPPSVARPAPPPPPRTARPAPPASPRTPAARSALRVRTSARGNSTQNGYAQVGGFRLVSMSSVSPIGEVCSKRAGRFS